MNCNVTVEPKQIEELAKLIELSTNPDIKIQLAVSKLDNEVRVKFLPFSSDYKKFYSDNAVYFLLKD